MSRKRTPDQPSLEAESTTATLTAEPEPAENPAPKQSFADRVGGPRKRSYGPDPFEIATDVAAGVRLFESKQDRQMAIKFGDGSRDQKPSDEILAKVKQAGYHWNNEHRIWAHPVRPESAMTTRIDAERLFQEVRGMIRQEKGIEAGQEVPF